jgi:hypothetical protein
MSVLLIPVPLPLSRLTLSQHYRSATSVAGYTFYPMLPRPFGEPRVSFGVPAHDRTLQLELISLLQTRSLRCDAWSYQCVDAWKKPLHCGCGMELKA